MHMVSPKSGGLFQRAIIESGPCETGVSEADAFAQGEQFVAALGCDIPEGGAGAMLECLRGQSVEAVMKALPSSSDLLFGMGANWFPVVDGWNLPDSPGKLLADGSFRLEEWERNGVRRPVYFFDYHGETIWGATARILKQYLDLIRE